VEQVLLKGIKGKSLKVTNLSQTADPAAAKANQEMLVDVDIEGDITVDGVNQRA